MILDNNILVRSFLPFLIPMHLYISKGSYTLISIVILASFFFLIEYETIKVR